ncbi:EboA domain-containing protein [Kribbella sancticallisti]|uniref:EboA domain-containing protein n=1 Tax=Kribbella sancticallisti TaxID=460087 RepID=A0ABP4Q219_9ACTN
MITADELTAQLPPPAAVWLAEAREKPLEEVFPAAARAVGREQLTDGRTVDQAVRGLLLIEKPAADLLAVYRFGDAAEKQAVLRSLSIAEVAAEVDGSAVDLLADAIRTNDQRLLAAALGEYATQWLPQAAFRQAVLKCVFAGVPLTAVDGLPARTDDELIRMMKDFAAERTAAGRVIPPDLLPYLSSAVSPS